MNNKQRAIAQYLNMKEGLNMTGFENLSDRDNFNLNQFENLSPQNLAAMAAEPDFMNALSPSLQKAIRSGNPDNLAAILKAGQSGNGKFPVRSNGALGAESMVQSTFDLNISAPVVVVPAGAPAVPNKIFNIALFGAGVSESNYVSGTIGILNPVINGTDIWTGVALPGALVAGGDPTAWYFTYSATNGAGTSPITWIVTTTFYAYTSFLKDLRNNILQINTHRITLGNPNNLSQYNYPYYLTNQSPMGKFGGDVVTLRSYKPPSDYTPWILDFKTADPWKVSQQDYILVGLNPNSALGSPNAINIAYDVVSYDRSGKN